MPRCAVMHINSGPTMRMQRENLQAQFSFHLPVCFARGDCMCKRKWSGPPGDPNWNGSEVLGSKKHHLSWVLLRGEGQSAQGKLDAATSDYIQALPLHDAVHVWWKRVARNRRLFGDERYRCYKKKFESKTARTRETDTQAWMVVWGS